MKLFKKIYEELTPKDKIFMIQVNAFSDSECNSVIKNELSKYKNTFTLWCCGKYRKWELPFTLIKPVYDYTSESISHHEWYVNKEYGIWVDGEHTTFKFGYVSDFLYNNNNLRRGKHYLFNYPWKLATRELNELLDSRMKLWHIPKCIGDEKVEFQPFKRYDLTDFDGVELTVDVRASHSIYSYGESKWMKWIMKKFKDPNEYYTLDLAFSKEIGKGKDSWKGGTTGHSVNLLHKEEPWNQAVSRYCMDPKVRGFKSTNEQNLTFRGERL